MKVKVTVYTSYVGCPEESFFIECESEEEFIRNHEYSTEILNAICDGKTPHYHIDYDFYDDDYEEDEEEDEEDY